MNSNNALTRSVTGLRHMRIKSCYLKSKEEKHKTILLHTGTNIIGRSIESGIRDPRCSKKQMVLKYDPDTYRIHLKVLGVNPCGVNGFMAMQGTECEVTHGDILEIVYGRHIFEVLYEPHPAFEIRNISNTSAEAAIELKNCSGLWESIENETVLIFTASGVRSSCKIAGYDIDGTIIRTKSGNVFPKCNDDWQLNYPEVHCKLKCLHEEGYKICFFSNQGGIARGKVNLNDFKQKVQNILRHIGVPVQVFIAVGDGFYRKPAPGMWRHLQEKKNDGVQINLAQSFYVGDAAGRPERGAGAHKRRKDHSLVDRLFAANIKVSFYTPEEHFLGSKTEHFEKPGFEPRDIENTTKPLFDPVTTKFPSAGRELLLLVGLPGSGKSHFAQKYLEPLGYRVLNADTLGNTKICVTGCERMLQAGHSCVVDNTNVDVETRKKYLDLSRTLKVPCRCLVFNVGLPQIKHNIAFRQLVDSKHVRINDMVMNIMKKKYKEPTIDEGFAEIICVNPRMQFDDTRKKDLYNLYLVEK